jgi:hypothetical protein
MAQLTKPARGLRAGRILEYNRDARWHYMCLFTGPPAIIFKTYTENIRIN